MVSVSQLQVAQLAKIVGSAGPPSPARSPPLASFLHPFKKRRVKAPHPHHQTVALRSPNIFGKSILQSRFV